ncbi:D-malate degradation protein R [Hartmannibacter diazotrophicus]|uniref:D-malate degradation protein R n=1 Tax=Hartmannibacter diazotrophicus TaxID=1482074 RepID=A0A2C9DE28_9HYPH|nr:LysR family transcriptional regulator [Hartmannibacter diazotrophicus]SON58398.1 D-malate degradation protein R [Hartmannibacter diazotrophicus]
MARIETNRSGEMEVFTGVVTSGSFSAAAATFGMTPSAVSKLVTRLEHRLGTRLFNRSTRKLQLTAEGCHFYERATRILADLDEAERCAAAGEKPQGRVRINTSASFANHILIPLVVRLQGDYPDIDLEFSLTDRVVDLLEDRADIAVRAGPMKASSLIARKLGQARMMIVGAPDYLARAGHPASAPELSRHLRLGHSQGLDTDAWPVLDDGETVLLPTSDRCRASDGEAIRHLALGGAGLARLPVFMVRTDIEAGRLVPVMEEANPGDAKDFHAVHVGQGGPLPARVRAVLDFLASHARIPNDVRTA